ncbi:hypothetical protein [Nocardiopsis protaetiae]|uniref:hypothetical protein n=1 Tax=Nocardiopsis protaetiae TaxID=3382270 RepID=UPI00387B4033
MPEERSYPSLWKHGAALAAVVMLATACGGDGGEGGGEGGDTAGDTVSQEPLAGEGFLAMDCGMGVINAYRFSDQDGSLLAQHSYNPTNTTATEEPRQGSARAPEGEFTTTLPNCDITEYKEGDINWPASRNLHHQLAGLFIPETSQLLVTLDEQANGAQVTTIGAMASDGTVEALLPAGGGSGFSDTLGQYSPRYNHNDGRVYYLEKVPGSGEGTVKSLDPASGDVQEIGSCTECDRIILDPHSGHIYTTTFLPSTDSEELQDASLGSDNYDFVRYFSSPEGTVSGHAIPEGWFMFVRARKWSSDSGLLLPTARKTDEAIVPQEGWSNRSIEQYEEDASEGELPLANRNPLFMVGEYELMLDDDLFTVVGLDPETLDLIDEPVRSIIQGGDRTNTTPVLSSDGTKVLFRSTSQDGSSGWYSVPVDGSAEPTEIGAVAPEYSAVFPIYW